MNDKRYPVNAGVQRPFPSVEVPGGFSVTQNVQLISERVSTPQQWVITLAPITLVRGVSVVPWANAIDGIVNPAFTPAQIGNIPYAAMPATPFRVGVDFGAGGIRNHAEFDYPIGGGTFSLTADTLDVNVFSPLGSPVLTVPDAGTIPVFGAMMVPGQASGASTMRLTDLFSSVNHGVGESAVWSVKPYARRVWVSNIDTATAGAGFWIRFFDAGGVTLWNHLNAINVVEVPVPSGATFMTVTSPGGGQLFRPMWEIELA